MRAWIPPNYNKNGGLLGGLLKKQNAIEAGVFLLLFSLLIKLAAKAIGFAPAVIFSVIIGLPVTILLLVGIKGESLMTTLKDYLYWQKTKKTVTLQMPAIEIKKEKRGKKNEKK